MVWWDVPAEGSTVECADGADRIVVWPTAGTAWRLFLCLTAALQASVLAVGAVNLCRRQCCSQRRRPVRGEVSASSPRQSRADSGSSRASSGVARWMGCGSLNLRDVILLLDCVGATIRVGWLVDPQGWHCIYSVDIASGFFLRTPQELWILAYFGVMYLWLSVIDVVRPNAGLLRRFGVWSLVLSALLVCVSVPTTLLAVLGIKRTLMRWISKGIFCVYALILVGVGVWEAVYVGSVLEKHRQRSAPALQKTLSRAIWNLRVTMVASLVFTIVLLVAITYILVADVGPTNLPRQYLAYYYVIYAFAEPGFAATLTYACWQSPALPFLCCGCLRRTHGTGRSATGTTPGHTTWGDDSQIHLHAPTSDSTPTGPLLDSSRPYKAYLSTTSSSP